MISAREPVMRSVSLQVFTVLSVFIFLGGSIAGMLFCAYFVHHESVFLSGITANEGIANQIERLENAVISNPDNVKSWTRLGNFYFDSDQYEKAIDAYQKSLSLEPNNPDVWTDLGVMYRRTEQPFKAIEAFDKAIDIDPKYEASRLNKGAVLMYDLNDRESAIRVWEDLLKVNPHAIAPGGEYLIELIREANGAGGAPSSTVGR
ncbi:MAG: tetratricopeptide repeat protein [Desulfobacteraceae bacterium]|nr:MAG: tetratricopeptide repeat protein [Desulfobacteraceae bacterium]